MLFTTIWSIVLALVSRGVGGGVLCVGGGGRNPGRLL